MRRSARTRSSMTPEDRVPRVSARIVLFGATGYTGELTARALVGDVAQPATVAALVEKGDVLVSTVGPFVRLGEPAVSAAVRAGAHYLDSTGEGAFIRAVFGR